jgi:hypothetical protein
MSRHLLLISLVLLGLISPGSAQLNVNIELKRRTYIRFEPILATVTITNLSGRDLRLEDAESQWFGFTIMHGDKQSLVTARNPNYHLDAFELGAGQTMKRTVNLLELYPITEYGLYRIRATIYSNQLNQYFTSRTANIDISEGRIAWKQVVGVPEAETNGGQMHEYALLTTQGVRHQYLYCRVTEPETGKVFGMYRLGHLIDGAQFDAQLDTTNTLHVLNLVGPKTYSLTQIGVNGKVHGQWLYDAPKVKPFLRRDGTGSLHIVGATRRVEAPKGEDLPKLSDRPPGLPR